MSPDEGIVKDGFKVLAKGTKVLAKPIVKSVRKALKSGKARRTTY